MDGSSSTLRLRAEITIDLDAADFLEAAEHQRRIEDLISAMRAEYRQAIFAFRPRRGPRSKKAAEPRASEIKHYTGRLHSYE